MVRERSAAPQMCNATSAEKMCAARRGSKGVWEGMTIPRKGNAYDPTKGVRCTKAESRFFVQEWAFRDLGRRRGLKERPFRDGKTFILACAVNLRGGKSLRRVGDCSCRIRGGHHRRLPIAHEWRDVLPILLERAHPSAIPQFWRH